MPKDVFTAPWYPWYVNDVLRSESIEMLTLAEEGAYRRALDRQWINGSVPADPKKCAEVIGNGCTPKIAERVLMLFVAVKNDPARKINKKLEKIRKEQAEKYQKKSASGRKNVLKRWNRKTSGDTSGNTVVLPTLYHTDTDTDSSKEEIKKTVSVPHAGEIFVGTVTAELQKRMDLKTLPSKLEWQSHAEWAHVNGFTADQFLECYDLLKRQHWRDGPVKPKHVAENLPNLQKLRNEIENQNNGKNNRTQTQPRGNVRSDRRDAGSDAEFLKSIGARPGD